MAQLLLLTTLVVIVISNLCEASPENIIKMKVEKDDRNGHARNCGKVPFTASWTPKLLRPSGKVTISVDFTSPYEFKSGYVDANVYFVGDDEPFLGYSDAVTCDQLKEYWPEGLCPIPKGIRLNQSRTLPNLRALSSYPGDYFAVVSVKNQDHQEMFCANLTISVLEGYN